MIQAIFQSTGYTLTPQGKAGTLVFTDLTLNGDPLAPKYSFGSLQCFKRLKPQEGDIFQFDAEIEQTPISLKILRPKNVEKISIEGFEESFVYAINKFLKSENSITSAQAKKERLAFARACINSESKIEFWKYIGLPFKLNSLFWFLTEDGLKFLQDQKKDFHRKKFNVIQERKEYEILENKVGERVLVDKKNQTLMDFLG